MKWIHGLFIPALCALFCGASPAGAGDTGIYAAARLTGGFQSVSDLTAGGGGSEHLGSDHSTALGFGGAIGLDLHSRFGAPARVELEAMHIATAKEEGSTSHLFANTGNFGYSQKNTISSVFVNAYLDWHNDTMFTPYAGLGLGTAWVRSKGGIAGAGTGSGKETNLAWNAGLGVSAELSYDISLDAGYRYAGFGKARTGGTPAGHHLESRLGMHQLILGLRYNF